MASHSVFSLWAMEEAVVPGTLVASASDKPRSSCLGEKQEGDSEEPRNFVEEELK